MTPPGIETVSILLCLLTSNYKTVYTVARVIFVVVSLQVFVQSKNTLNRVENCTANFNNIKIVNIERRLITAQFYMCVPIDGLDVKKGELYLSIHSMRELYLSIHSMSKIKNSFLYLVCQT